jgi:hypothetical protein
MSDKVTMKALDTVHMSNVSPENLVEGDVFQVSEAEAKILEDRGVAERGGKAADAVNSEAAIAARPDTREALDAERGAKAEKAAPENKMISAASVKAPAQRKGR